ncbi:translation initiation factor IF-2 [Desulfosarcina sp. BuS5]|nr:translation initiation factor IF-2 [Desulfosarcina sp. BuS5]WDN88137.1 translation initiation factor IF-2 [Desulfosarcina sp. BuS5]
MAKTRVYELARDLNMANKDLLDRIKSLDISVKSHMASLDDDLVVMIKANILEKKQTDLEVTRVKPTVIRRRRKVAEKKPIKEPPEPETLPEQVIHAEEPVKTDLPEPDKKTEEKKDLMLKTEEKEDLLLKEEKTVEPVHKKETITTEPLIEEPVKAVKTPDRKVKKPVKKLKTEKKETPAKIIHLPAPSLQKAPEETKPVTGKPKSDIKSSIKTRTTETKPDKTKKKENKQQEKVAADQGRKEKHWSKKKISFRRKEVVEGKALFTGKKRAQKGKKGVHNKKTTPALKTHITTPKAIKRRIKIDDAITLSELAKRMGIKANDMIAQLMTLGIMATVNQTIDFDTAALIASEFNYEIEKASFEEDTILRVKGDDTGNLVARPPVVTIMGHVDHGKTSLLDVIRKTSVTDAEAGGITQHIGAYHVKTDKGHIVFLDTPGHEAFTAMRSRGASITDIVILVVAADDGVMPQTIEAINHSKVADVPIIVAINKIDKPDADPDRVQRELAESGLVPEDWGGDTIFVNVSAKHNQGIGNLLEMVLLQAEVLELKANPDKLASGHVVEAKLDSGRGAVATILVQQGTLKTGDPVVCGIHYGKVRAMLNDRGKIEKTAGPSIPVGITGLSGVPNAGDELIALSDEKDAKHVSAHRIRKQRAKELAKSGRLSLEKLYEKMQKGKVSKLNLIIKADVQGSIEAIEDSLTKLSNQEVKINIIHSATGTVVESDISLAAVSDAIIIGFNVRPNIKIESLAGEEHVDMRFYNIIYNVINDIKGAISGMMASTFKEHIHGRAEIREVYHIPKVGTIAGSYVTDGKIERGELVRLLREGIITYEGKIASLRRFKDDVKEVSSGYECGIGIENYNDIKTGDTIECYHLEEIKAKLE